VVAVVDAGPPSPPEPVKPPEEPPSLELTVEPAVDFSIDGNPAGRGSFSGPLEPGKHLVQITDKGRMLNVTRSVNVKKTGKTVEKITIGKGHVSISAPDGAAISIDGIKVGTAPSTKEIAVYEGAHRVTVMVGKARWSQAFTVRADERMYFNVEAQ
jgi:hypothetical protein